MKTIRAGGFSLVEMLVVLAIIALILGLMAPKILQQFGGAQHKAAQSNVELLGSRVANFYLDVGKIPERLEDLVEQPSGAEGWLGPYAKKSALKDPWGHDYHYDYPGQHDEFDIYSYGADNRQGGDGKNADISSWE